MNLELDGKSALITGASRGIGKAIALALHAQGCRVMLNGRSASSLDALAAQIGERVSYFAADVTDPVGCAGLMSAFQKEFGMLDILICNVGSGTSIAPGTETHREWERMLKLNLHSATNMVEAASTAFAHEGASIVCISSICGIEALGAPLPYSSAKAALNSYVTGVARPLARKGIRINAVAPGNILFAGSSWEKKLAADQLATAAMLKREVALQRFGTPEEIADLCLFLASPRASFITGAVYVIDGGQVRS